MPRNFNKLKFTICIFVNFQSHKAVSLRKSSAFSRWHAGWVRQNVTDSAHQAMDHWFMGKTDELLPNRTQKIARTFMQKTPYRLYHKYMVELLKNNLANPNAPPSSILSTS